MPKHILLLIIVFAGLTYQMQGQIAYYEVGSTGKSPSYVINGVAASDLSRGSGLTPVSDIDEFTSSAFTTVNAIDFNDYIEFNLTPGTGMGITVSTITVNYYRNPSGPGRFELRSSSDNFTTVLSEANICPEPDVDCSIVFDAGSLKSNESLTFRIYGYNSLEESGVWGFYLLNVSGDVREYSDLQPPVSQIPSKIISSLSTENYMAVDVFNFRLKDEGNDGLPTFLTSIKLVPGVTNTVQWASVIQGVQIFENESTLEFWPTTITNDSIYIPTYSSLGTFDNSSTELTIRVYLNTSGITDNQILSFHIPQTGHGFTSDEFGSGIRSSISGPISSNDHTISVTGTNLNFITRPSTITLNENFTVSVEATDANGNRDLDANNSVTLSLSGGNGILSSGSSLTRSLSSGTATWTDLQYNTQQQFEISASATGLTSSLASNISFFTPVNASDLIISEYVEGTANNKYIEIYNGTGYSVNLSTYSLRLYPDGATSADPSVQLSGTLPSGQTKVYKNPSASLTLPDGVTALDNSAVNFDGNDAFALYKNESLVDLIGNIGENPGSAWISNAYSTAGKTLRRKSSISRGISTDPVSGFPTLESEWDLNNDDDVSGLGVHTYSASTVIGREEIAAGPGTYEFGDRYLSLLFESVGSGGILDVAFFPSGPQNVNGSIPNNVSQYRWVINNNGVSNFNATFRVPRSESLGISSTGNDVVKLYKRSTPGTGNFTDLGYMQYDNVNDEFYKTGITSFSEFVLGSEDPLPVELISFTARASGTTVNLMWETSTETDNNGFEIEKNTNGTWQKIGFVEGHSTTNSPKYYKFTDNNATGNWIRYRLKQIDNTGTFEYSPEVEIELNPVQFSLFQNYPNPFNPETVIKFALKEKSNVTLDVYNIEGQKVAELISGEMEKGFYEERFDGTNLSSGVYVIRLNAQSLEHVNTSFTKTMKALLLK